MFYFQTMFQNVYASINQGNYMGIIVSFAEAILLLCTLFAVYEAWARGGDVRALGLASVRYLAMGLVITQYSSVFVAVNNGFVNVAQLIQPSDVMSGFRAQVAGYLNSLNGVSAWWQLIPGGISAGVSLVFQIVALVIFPITYAIFSFFYSMYGAVLYVCGPLVLALYPSFGIGQLARTYMVNLMVWNSWGIIYAIFSQLLTGIGANNLDNVLTAQSFGGLFQGASQMLLIALSGILMSLMIALIPFIAKRVVSGDLGSTMFAVLGAAATAFGAAAVGAAGFHSGSYSPPASANSGNAPGSTGSNSGGGNHGSSNRPPTGPRPHGLEYLPYGAGWAAGRAVRALD
jgi:hypothetical protein